MGFNSGFKGLMEVFIEYYFSLLSQHLEKIRCRFFYVFIQDKSQKVGIICWSSRSEVLWIHYKRLKCRGTPLPLTDLHTKCNVSTLCHPSSQTAVLTVDLSRTYLITWFILRINTPHILLQIFIHFNFSFSSKFYLNSG